MTELTDFVLNYCRRAGALIEPSADGVYDVLLPDDVSAQWHVPALQRFAFEDGRFSADMTRLGYGHPLVEQMAESARSEPLCGRLYVNEVRLDKHGLADLARAALTFPNARLIEAPRQTESRAMSHYVRFNFKAALITDERREQLVSVMMDAQAGHAVKELAQIEELAPLEAEPAFKNLATAPLRWRKEAQPLSRAALDGLLERASRAALVELAPAIESLQRHAARYLDLDHARLEEYYDHIERDLQRRAERTAEDKRAAIESKLAAARVERQAKLADVEAKYKLRVELALVNLLVVEQPKVVRVVQIENRTITVTRTVVWDPLLHRIEPLVCDACGQPSTRLFLCSGGHLAHEECLLPQCVDCKRAFCKLCENQMSACAVCDRPVCVPSLNRCGECGRSTCREHVGLCHANEGQPVKIVAQATKEEIAPEPAPAPVQEPEKPHISSLKRKKMEREAASRAREAQSLFKGYPTAATGYKIEVRVDAREPVVMAGVLTAGNKPIAVRTWELVKDGILVTCQCEKFSCPANETIFEPEDAANIEVQIEYHLDQLRQEYRVPAGRVTFFSHIRDTLRPMRYLTLHGEWKDDHVLSAARAMFRSTYAPRRRRE
jgi:hypothetical protein